MVNFLSPNTIEEAKELLNEKVNTKLLAGGTDLLLEIKREKYRPDNLIDLRKLSELSRITEKEDKVTLGSMVTFTQLLENKIIADNFGSLTECAKNMGSPQIRNMATIGGNIVNAGSAADVVPCIISLQGTLVIESASGTRVVSCEGYYNNYAEEKVKENEILTKIIVPKKQQLSGYYKLGKRNSLAIARVSAAFSLQLEGNTIKSLVLCLGAVGRFPFRAKELEKLAVGKDTNWLFEDEPLSLLESQVYESIKNRKTMPFKREAIKGVYKEALRKVLGL